MDAFYSSALLQFPRLSSLMAFLIIFFGFLGCGQSTPVPRTPSQRSLPFHQEEIFYQPPWSGLYCAATGQVPTSANAPGVSGLVALHRSTLPKAKDINAEILWNLLTALGLSTSGDFLSSLPDDKNRQDALRLTTLNLSAQAIKVTFEAPHWHRQALGLPAVLPDRPLPSPLIKALPLPSASSPHPFLLTPDGSFSVWLPSLFTGLSSLLSSRAIVIHTQRETGTDFCQTHEEVYVVLDWMMSATKALTAEHEAFRQAKKTLVDRILPLGKALGHSIDQTTLMNHAATLDEKDSALPRGTHRENWVRNPTGEIQALENFPKVGSRLDGVTAHDQITLNLWELGFLIHRAHWFGLQYPEF